MSPYGVTRPQRVNKDILEWAYLLERFASCPNVKEYTSTQKEVINTVAHCSEVYLKESVQKVR